MRLLSLLERPSGRSSTPWTGTVRREAFGAMDKINVKLPLLWTLFYYIYMIVIVCFVHEPNMDMRYTIQRN